MFENILRNKQNMSKGEENSNKSLSSSTYINLNDIDEEDIVLTGREKT